MNGPLAQIVALTCHANTFLHGGEIGPFFPGNSTCAFCEEVRFVALEKSFFGQPREKEIAKTPQDWFQRLKASGAGGIRLVWRPQNDPRLPDRMSAGFVGGGGTWLMEVLLPKGRSEFWAARWQVGNRDAPDRRIWRVTYARVGEGVNAQFKAANLDATSARLTHALREILAFSAEQKLDGFTQCFADALDTLESDGKNLHGYHRDLAPSGHLALQARMLLDACQKAWVFGGMGSWNDMGFEGEPQKKYESVSEQLFQALNQAISEAASQGCRPRNPERVDGAATRDP